MHQALIKFMEEQKVMLLQEMDDVLGRLDIPNNLKDSMAYSLQAGGKRLRPVLLAASNAAYDSNPKKIQSSALALEMIHTYSLIHDDLPAMDDDDYRRGKLTNHKKFDEATAILAGDALLTYSFELIAGDPELSDTEKVQLIKMLASASGPEGMVAGQILDMEAERKPASLAELERIHALKTGALLEFAIHAGAYLGKASAEQLSHLKEFAHYLGLIFQVQDDLLDVTGDPEKLGKPVGSDVANEKSTYPKLLGLDGAEEMKEIYVQKAKTALVEAGAADSYLMLLIDHISRRDH
ncbi:polyprenyl synthetase family protein [Aciduricibacillus chroicocephali]|uniref:Polyprenyl synthetase family protein n=1 Tax=Aciduricibacillus chroicocephali TaxID=3054939 RepID=A0ABY9KV50_9BACI|nr:polyprenyl synthetase family protein [Bacillaceae bacterium 44XB]